MEPHVTDKPFKLSAWTIRILKDLSVFQSKNCRENIPDEPIME